MGNPIRFNAFDKNSDFQNSFRNLPHWFQPNVAVFLTFRTNDSMPRDIVNQWNCEQRDWLNSHDWDIKEKERLPEWEELTDSLRIEFRKFKNQRWNSHLDTCYGECLLQRHDMAEIVKDSLLHFNGQRYDLDCFVVMPNHVHVLVQFRRPMTCREQCKSWLHYTAAKINKLANRSGTFWQSEPFDHLVRSAEQFYYLRSYIAENGVKANLSENSYLFWSKG